MSNIFAIVLMAVIAVAAAKPSIVAPLPFSPPLISAAPAAAVYTPGYYGNFASPYAPAPFAAAAPVVASPYAASALNTFAGLAGFASPYTAGFAAAPYAAGLASPYAAAFAPPYASPYAPQLLLK